MKKNGLVKGLLAVLFVFAAGIFYLGMTGGEEEPGILLREQEAAGFNMQTVAGSGVQTANGSAGRTAVQNSIAAAGKEPGLSADSSHREEDGALVYVHVCGAVKNPGVYALAEGSRTADAVLCAGDFLPEAARDYLNLAQPVKDGQKIYVPDRAEADRLPEGGIFSGEGSAGQMPEEEPYVNINTASQGELMTLPGIGKAKADAIVAYRKEHGAFLSCEDLMQVPGIKENIYEKLRDAITVGR